MFLHNKIIEYHQAGGLGLAPAHPCPDELVNVIHLFLRGVRLVFSSLSLPKVALGRVVAVPHCHLQGQDIETPA